jgi:effector-associated domain 7 (EAD7)-containing protein
LRERMIRHFSIPELDEICADVQSDLARDGIEIQVSLEIVGGDGKPARIQNLIEYLDRRGYLSYLIKAVQAARPGQNII